jgi:hypothetical protein
MTVYGAQIATAKRLIASKGERVVWREPAAAVVPDVNKPWIETDAAAPIDYSVRIVFLPIDRINSQLFRYVKDSGTPRGTVMGLMAAVPFTPTLTGRVTRTDGSALGVRSVEPLAPDGTPIIWTVEFMS